MKKIFLFFILICFLFVGCKTTKDAGEVLPPESQTESTEQVEIEEVPPVDENLDEIITDLEASHRMNRLLQGDVGSGKTIVAFIGMYANYLSGYQSALMAPTEILATQHYEEFKERFEGTGINVAFLSGSLKAKQKRETLEKIKSGEAQIIIGITKTKQVINKPKNADVVCVNTSGIKPSNAIIP
mgnify:CR=1 FL=1